MSRLVTNSTISLPSVLCDSSPLPLRGHTPAPSCDNRGSVWQGLGASNLSGMLVNCPQPVFGTGHNNTHPQQAFWTSGFGLPRLSWTVSAWLQACGLQAALHVCWPDASVVADPQRGPGLEKQPPNKHLQVLRSVVVHHQRFQGCEECDQERRRLLRRGTTEG